MNEMATNDRKRINHPRECCICCHDVSGHVVQTGCGHVYHFGCLRRWLTSNSREAVSRNSGTSGLENVDDVTEEEQLAHVIDLTTDSIHPNNKLCPMCKDVINEDDFIHSVWT